MKEEAINILKIICWSLDLDLDKLTAYEKIGVTQKYRDAKLLASYIIRRTVIIDSKSENKRHKTYIQYAEIGKLFNRLPQSIMAAELKCNDLLKTDKEFKFKYDLIIKNLKNGGST